MDKPLLKKIIFFHGSIWTRPWPQKHDFQRDFRTEFYGRDRLAFFITYHFPNLVPLRLDSQNGCVAFWPAKCAKLPSDYKGICRTWNTRKNPYISVRAFPVAPIRETFLAETFKSAEMRQNCTLINPPFGTREVKNTQNVKTRKQNRQESNFQLLSDDSKNWITFSSINKKFSFRHSIS